MVIVFFVTITILLIVTLLTVLNSRSGDSTTVVEELHEQVSGPEHETWPNWASVSQNTFTVLLLTYKRTDILGRVLDFHCNFTLVDRVIVVWNDVDKPTIPEEFTNYKCSKELFFKRPLVNSLNNRFIPYPEIRTEGMNSLFMLIKHAAIYIIITPKVNTRVEFPNLKLWQIVILDKTMFKLIVITITIILVSTVARNSMSLNLHCQLS